MLSERQLQDVLGVFEKRMQSVIEQYIKLMGEHIRDIGRLTPSDVNRLVQMKRVNANIEKIKRQVAKAVKLSLSDVETAFKAVAESDYRFAAELFGADHMPRIKDNKYLERILKAQLRITKQELANISRTTIIPEQYRNAVDIAIQTAQAGVTDYNSAIRTAMKDAASSGLRVEYPSGLTRRLDTAVRMNVLDGIRAINRDVMQQAGKEFKADGIEISAHALCAEDHLPYQGTQMSNKEFERLQNRLDRPFGMWNCKHMWWPILLGISQPTHTKEELRAYAENSNELITIDGATKTRYQWTQEQRRLETAIRHHKDAANLYKASGDTVGRRNAQATINALRERYSKVSEAAGLREDVSRMRVAGFIRVKAEDELKNPFSTLKNATKNGILIVTETRTGHASARPQGEPPNTVLDIVGKHGGISRFIYNDTGMVRYRVDNNDHFTPSEHNFPNGEHYHVAKWDGETFKGFTKGAQLPDALHRLCQDILKGGN